MSFIKKIRAALFARDVGVGDMAILRKFSKKLDLKFYVSAKKMRLTPAM